MKEVGIVTIVKVEDEQIIFDNGWLLESFHFQECCENHYLAVKAAADELLGEKLDLSKEFFERVKGYGIRLLIEDGHPVPVAGYGENSGYYGSSIHLLLKDSSGETVKSFDVSECQSEVVDNYF